MIRFASPLFFLALPAVGFALWFFFPRHRSQFALRFAAVAAVVMALAEPQLAVRDDQDYAVFLVDRSASVRRTVRDIDTERRLKELMGQFPEWQFGVISFAKDASAVTAMGDPFLELPVDQRSDAGSRFDRAVELGLAMMPSNGANRLVLVSDGRLHGTTLAGVTTAQLAGVPISIIPIGYERSNDTRLASFAAPSEVPADRPFELRIEISSQQETYATLALYRDSELTLYDEILLAEGTTTYLYHESLAERGFAEYTAVIKRAEDLFPENDTRSVLVQTSDRPSVLLVDPSSGSAIASLLEAIGIAYTLESSIPDLTVLSSYRQLIVAGLPLTDLTAADTAAIEQFVENLGGGLLVVQGEAEVRGFGGGPIDPLLPVSFTTPEKERDPSLAIVYLLDRSKSMAELVEMRAKIRIMREAAAASVFLLPADTLVGLVGFDDDFDWLFPVQPVGDATAVYSALQRLRAGGGTSMYAPLNEAIDTLIDTVARVKHVLIVSDGKASDAGSDYPALLARLAAEENMTLSAIALGDDPNLLLLGALVEAGRGALYHVVDFLALPQATMEITQHLGRSRFITGTIAVTGSLLDEETEFSIPPLSGYVLTYPRAPSTVLLAAGDDPVAATWRTGLGSVTVLNVDLSGVWTEEWLAWPHLSALFQKLLATTQPLIPASAGLFPSVSLDHETVTFIVDARSATGGFADFLDVQAKLLPGDADLDPVQVAPGVYRARFPRPEEGGYAINVFDASGQRSTRYSFSVPYATEYEAIGRDDAALQQIAEATGGAILPEGSLDSAVRPAGAVATKPLFRAFLVVALFLLLVDIALRKSKFRRVPIARRGRRAQGVDQSGPAATRSHIKPSAN